MKFLVFSDFHYDPGYFLCTGLRGLADMQACAREEGCDFIVQLGDFCHGVSGVPELLAAYNDFDVPSYHVLGNHDAERDSFANTVRAYGMPHEYYFFDVAGYRMIVLNPNYFADGDRFVHYELVNWRGHDATRDVIPPEQIAWLRETVASSPYPCVLLSHQSLERVDGVRNREEVLEIINAANRRKKGSVLLCINGHYHRDNLRILDGVCYLDLNSASIDWVEKAHYSFPTELHEQVKKLHHLVVFEQPLYAIVEIEGSTIDIKGTSSPMLYGVDYVKATGSPCYDRCGRPFTQSIQSARITLE